MKLIGSMVALVAGIVLLGALGGGALLAIRAIAARFAALDPAVANVTAIACAAALVSTIVIARSIDAAGRRQRTTLLREEKTATYQLLVDFWTNRLQVPRVRSAEVQADLMGKRQVLDRLLALYGAAPVVRAHAALSAAEQEEGLEHRAAMARMAGVLVAIRRDLGSDTPQHLGEDLARLLIPSVDEHVQPRIAVAGP
jgi:hypothetical protein